MWSNIYSKLLRIFRSKTDEDLYTDYYATDSISFKSAILLRLLSRRNKVFEKKIAQSVSYPHEIDWEEIGDEMFTLLQMSQKVLFDVVTQSHFMQEFIPVDYLNGLRKLAKKGDNDE